jgi:hypothetical protein
MGITQVHVIHFRYTSYISNTHGHTSGTCHTFQVHIIHFKYTWAHLRYMSYISGTRIFQAHIIHFTYTYYISGAAYASNVYIKYFLVQK